MYIYFYKFLLFSLLFLLIESFVFGQLSYHKTISVKQKTNVSNIAYKLPYRGENYKFYGTLKFHIFEKAYVNNKVYNTFSEAQHISKQNIKNINIRIFRASSKKRGYLNPYNSAVCGNILIFMCPMKKKDKPLKFYYRTGLFRYFYRFNAAGKSKNGKLCIDFETLAQYIINTDDAAQYFGLKIKSVSVKRSYIKSLYQSSSGEKILKRKIRFLKYLNPKMNRKYEELFLIEFEEIE